MAASKYDFAIEQGSSFKLSIIYKDSAGIPINLTNYCARLIWKTNTGMIQVLSSEEVNHNMYKFVINDEEGKITLLIPSYTTNSFLFSTAKYDLELQSNEPFYGSGSPNDGGKYTVRLLFGTINVVKRYSQTSTELDCSI
jgi:hypothetical protein